MSEYDDLLDEKDAAEEVLTERDGGGRPEQADLSSAAPRDSALSSRSVNTPSEARLLMDELGRYGHFSPRGTKCKLCGKEHK